MSHTFNEGPHQEPSQETESSLGPNSTALSAPTVTVGTELEDAGKDPLEATFPGPRTEGTLLQSTP